MSADLRTHYVKRCRGPNDFISGTGLIQDLNDLITQDINIVLYHGDADYIVKWTGGEAVANEIDAPGFSQAGFENISTPDNTVHGQVNHATTFSFVRVYEAGHEVPFYQPEFALTMFSRAISVSGGKRNSSFQAASPGSQYNTTTGEPSSPCTSGVSRITGTL
jgi:carboxypeptidase D